MEGPRSVESLLSIFMSCHHHELKLCTRETSALEDPRASQLVHRIKERTQLALHKMSDSEWAAQLYYIGRV